mmetsp:Transcript_59016/g.127673  ORF Transcript_59016/g.127673 Transcript_59016/m.127673 type:complete len:205 (-) Transcript_59016:1841-2455(-)
MWEHSMDPLSVQPPPIDFSPWIGSAICTAIFSVAEPDGMARCFLRAADHELVLSAPWIILHVIHRLIAHWPRHHVCTDHHVRNNVLVNAWLNRSLKTTMRRTIRTASLTPSLFATSTFCSMSTESILLRVWGSLLIITGQERMRWPGFLFWRGTTFPCRSCFGCSYHLPTFNPRSCGLGLHHGENCGQVEDLHHWLLPLRSVRL